ncbi:MAG TPA: DUF1272 domain-containing protein [Blastocatellia bacterium]|nr:DUF1272 domain-containing protein [Blastocatellia bacterium]
MALKMRDRCEKCEQVLALNGAAFICSYECTFWANCAQAMERICPNCQGEHVPRPKRKGKSDE